MRKTFLGLLLLVQSLLFGREAAAAPCVSGTLSSYVALLSGGCTIGTLRFSDFRLYDAATGAIQSTSISVTPVMVGSTIVGVDFGVGPTASNGRYFDDLIGYRVSNAGSNVNGATVSFAGSSVTGDAAVSVAEQLCLGGTFGSNGVSGCTSNNALNLAVIDVGFGADPPYSLSFAPIGSIGVTTDIAFDSGSGFVPNSSSTLTSASNRFNLLAAPAAVPEPAIASLLFVGLIGVAASRRRRSSTRRAALS